MIFPSVEILCCDWYGCTIYHFAQILEKSTKIPTSSEKTLNQVKFGAILLHYALTFFYAAYSDTGQTN